MSKKLIGLFLLAGSLLSAQVIELSGDKAYPPYSYFEKGEAKGAYVDVIKSAFDKIPGYEVKFNMVAWKKAIALTKQGKTAGFFPPYFNDKRTAWTKFSEPVIAEVTGLFAKEETVAGKSNFPDDFHGMTLCLNRGFSALSMGGVKLEKAIADGTIKLIEGSTNKACLSRVDRGIADVYLNNELMDTSSFPMVKKVIDIKENSGYVGFTLKTASYPFMADVMVKFNTVIKDMKKSGEVEKILQNYK